MQCILCLNTPDESINIFGENGLRLEIKEIITKHFWLEPIEDDTNSNSICPPCWSSLESFHKFYEEIKKAHCSFIEIKPANEVEEDMEVEAHSSDYVVDDYNDILYQAIKVEMKEETLINERLEFDNVTTAEENIKPQIELDVKFDQDLDSAEADSDSEIPLSKLSKKTEISESKTNAKAKVKKILTTNDDDDDEVDKKVHLQDGIWLATCFAQETSDKPISHKELDKFIKLNMELMCEICRIPVKDFQALQKHFKNSHKGKTFVTCCDKKFSLRSRLVDHILLHKLPDYFACVVCSKVVSSRENLRKHMIVHDKKFDFQCDKCDRTFYRKQLLDRHMDTHVLDRKFKCDKCDKLFTSKFSLGQHIYGVHKGGYKKICEQCGKVSRDHEAFVRHQLIHTNQPKPFVECPKCGIKLVDKNGLRKHIQSQHPDETREHICTECGIVTNTIFALRRHITFMHKRKRDHKCQVCDKAFKRALTLKLNDDDIDFNLICSSCWKSLQSFHNFYNEIEEAHRLFAKASPISEDTINDQVRESVNDSPMDGNDEILYQDIKIEFNDELNTKQLLDIEENNKNSIEFEVKSNDIEYLPNDLVDQEDSDSEIPLSKLTEQLADKKDKIEHSSSPEPDNKSQELFDNLSEPDDKGSETIDKAPESVDKTPEPIDKEKKDKKIHIHEGKWLATCFGEETVKKPISHDDLDKFLKLNTQLTCEMCRIPMEDFAALQAHFKDTHPVKPFVTCCDKKFELRCRLVDHILLHKLPNYFTCVVCSKVLSCRLNLRKHMDVHDKKQLFECDKCDKTFLRKEVFNRHVLDIHTLDRKFKCEECDKLFASKCSLNTHIYGVHKGRYKKICEQCGKVSCDQETFLRHQMKHSNQPIQYFQCPKCTVKLSTKHGLRHHIRYQHSEDTREHVCNVCGTIANNEAALKRHITFMHKYKRDFKCTMCEKAFKRAVTLKPNAKMNNAKYICCSCWKTVESFHKFYKSIEEAHIKLNASQNLLDKDDESTHFERCSELTTVVKQEHCDDTIEVEIPQISESIPPIYAVVKREQEEEILNSESEVTHKLNITEEIEYDSDDSFSEAQNGDDNLLEGSDNDCTAPKKKSKPKVPRTITFGNNKIPYKEFDSFINKNMELSCGICNKPMKNFFSVKGHFKLFHNTTEPPYVTCCDTKWTSRCSLVNHLLLHKDPDLFKSAECGRVLSSMKAFNYHMQTHSTATSVAKDGIHSCNKCNEVFSSVANLVKHLRSHITKNSDQSPINCTICGRMLVNANGLRRHMKNMHTKDHVQLFTKFQSL